MTEDKEEKKRLAAEKAAAATAEYRAGEAAKRANMARLKAERLAKEAGEPDTTAKPQAKPKKPR